MKPLTPEQVERRQSSRDYMRASEAQTLPVVGSFVNLGGSSVRVAKRIRVAAKAPPQPRAPARSAKFTSYREITEHLMKNPTERYISQRLPIRMGDGYELVREVVWTLKQETTK